MIHFGVGSQLVLLWYVRHDSECSLGVCRPWNHTADAGGPPLGGHESRTMSRARGSWSGFLVAAWHTRDEGEGGDLETSVSSSFRWSMSHSPGSLFNAGEPSDLFVVRLIGRQLDGTVGHIRPRRPIS